MEVELLDWQNGLGYDVWVDGKYQFSIWNHTGRSVVRNRKGRYQMTRKELYEDYVAQCINGLDDIEDEPARYIALEYSDDYLVWCATFDTVQDTVDYLNTSDTSRTSEDIIDLDTEESFPLKLVLAYPQNGGTK